MSEADLFRNTVKRADKTLAADIRKTTNMRNTLPTTRAMVSPPNADSNDSLIDGIQNIIDGGYQARVNRLRRGDENEHRSSDEAARRETKHVKNEIMFFGENNHGGRRFSRQNGEENTTSVTITLATNTPATTTLATNTPATTTLATTTPATSTPATTPATSRTSTVTPATAIPAFQAPIILSQPIAPASIVTQVFSPPIAAPTTAEISLSKVAEIAAFGGLYKDVLLGLQSALKDNNRHDAVVVLQSMINNGPPQSSQLPTATADVTATPIKDPNSLQQLITALKKVKKDDDDDDDDYDYLYDIFFG